MLTQHDFDEIEKILDEKLENKFNQKLKVVLSKDDFYDTMDKLFGEIKAVREEMPIVSHQLADHEVRISK